MYVLQWAARFFFSWWAWQKNEKRRPALGAQAGLRWQTEVL
jgi:hypothetical protein